LIKNFVNFIVENLDEKSDEDVIRQLTDIFGSREILDGAVNLLQIKGAITETKKNGSCEIPGPFG